MKSRIPRLSRSTPLRRPLTTSARRANQDPNLPPQLSSLKDLGFTARPGRERDFSKLDLHIPVSTSSAKSFNLAAPPGLRPPRYERPFPVVSNDRETKLIEDRDTKSAGPRVPGQYQQRPQRSEQRQRPHNTYRSDIASDSTRAFLPNNQGTPNSRPTLRNNSRSAYRERAPSSATATVSSSPSSPATQSSGPLDATSQVRDEKQSSSTPQAVRQPVSNASLDTLNSDAMQDLMSFDIQATSPARAQQRPRNLSQSNQQRTSRPGQGSAQYVNRSDQRSGQPSNRPNQRYGPSTIRPIQRSGPSSSAYTGGYPRNPPASGSSRSPPGGMVRTFPGRQPLPPRVETRRLPRQNLPPGDTRFLPVNRTAPPPPRVVPVDTTFAGAFGHISLMQNVVISRKQFSDPEKRKAHLLGLAGSYSGVLPRDLPPPYDPAVAARPVERAKADAAWTLALNQDVSMSKARAVREIMTKFTR